MQSADLVFDRGSFREDGETLGKLEEVDLILVLRVQDRQDAFGKRIHNKLRNIDNVCSLNKACRVVSNATKARGGHCSQSEDNKGTNPVHFYPKHESVCRASSTPSETEGWPASAQPSHLP